MTTFQYAPPPSLDDPYADEWTEPFWAATREERLTASRCANCGRFRLPPSRFCPQCRHQEIEWVDLPGTGRVYSFIVVRHPLRPDMFDYVPYVPAVIEPDGADGARFVSNVVDVAPENVTVDMAVRVVWNHVSDSLVLPWWTAA